MVCGTWLRAAVVVGISVGASCSKGAAVAVPAGVAVKVRPVKKSGETAATRYSAQIIPSTRLDLQFKVGGYVETIAQVNDTDGKPRNLQEGDQVAAGTVLASLRTTDYLQKIAEAKAGVAQAYALYHEAQLDASRDTKLAAVGSLAGQIADTSGSHRDSAAAQLEGAQVHLSQAQTALADTKLISPMAGVVVKRAIEVGTLAAPGTVAFTIADVKNVKAVFGVPDLVLSQIALGDVEKVSTDAFPGIEFAGKVSRLAPSADNRTRVFEVDITIPNPNDQLKAGMVASLSIAPTATSADLALPQVPLNAIVRPPSGKGYAVFVVETKDGVPHAHAVNVELGEYLGSVVPVKSGLKGDEQVVVQGAGLLSDGEQVEVIP